MSQFCRFQSVSSKVSSLFVHHLIACSNNRTFGLVGLRWSKGSVPLFPCTQYRDLCHSLLINEEPGTSIKEKWFRWKILLNKFRNLNTINKCWQENSDSTGITFLFLHIYFRYYMISQKEPFGHSRKKTKSMQRLIAKKGPIDLFALMCAGANSRSHWISRKSLFLVPLNP